ncbi:hypothetical protein ACWEWX_54820, partial [Streptomyces asiaticus]
VGFAEHLVEDPGTACLAFQDGVVFGSAAASSPSGSSVWVQASRSMAVGDSSGHAAVVSPCALDAGEHLIGDPVQRP